MTDNHQTDMIRRSISRLGLAFLAGTAVIYGVQMLTGFLVQLVKPQWLEDPTMQLVLSVIPMYLVGMPVLIFLVKRLPGESPEKHNMKPGQFLLALIMCYTVMYSTNLVGTAITGIIGLLKGTPVNNEVLDIATNANMTVTFFYMVLCAPVLEEYIFRKLIIDRTLKFGQGVAVLLSGLMFGLFHGNVSQFVYATALGMFFAFLYIKTGKLKIVILLHMFINFMGAIVSVLLLKWVGLDELTEISANTDPQAVLNLVMGNLPAWIAYMAYVCLILMTVVAGIILFIVFHKKFYLEPGELSLPKGKRFTVLFLNFGMAIYCLFWIAMMVVQLVR